MEPLEPLLVEAFRDGSPCWVSISTLKTNAIRLQPEEELWLIVLEISYKTGVPLNSSACTWFQIQSLS